MFSMNSLNPVTKIFVITVKELEPATQPHLSQHVLDRGVWLWGIYLGGVCLGDVCPGGCLTRGVWSGGVWSGGVSQHVLGRGVSAQGGVCLGLSAWGCLPKGVSARGVSGWGRGCLVRGCLPGGVCHTHPPTHTKQAREWSSLALKTQGRHHQKPQTRIPVAPQKELMSSKYFEKKQWQTRNMTDLVQNIHKLPHNKTSLLPSCILKKIAQFIHQVNDLTDCLSHLLYVLL